MTKQYYYKNEACRAASSFDDDCICWHDVGTGPVAPADQPQLTVRTKHDISHGGEAAIDRSYNWLPIDANTPRGVKLQLINKRYGVATYGQIFSDNCFWTHFCPLPTFKKE